MCPLHSIVGITNLNGKIVSVLNLQTLFGSEAQYIDEKSYVFVVKGAGLSIALLADNVHHVSQIERSNFVPTQMLGYDWLDSVQRHYRRWTYLIRYWWLI